MKRIVMAVGCVFLLASCGSDDDAEVSPRDRCSDTEGYHVEGQFVVDGDSDLTFSFSNTSSTLEDGYIRSGAIQIQPGLLKRAEDVPPILLKFRDNEDTTDLLDLLANATQDGSKTYAIADGTSVPSNAVRRSDLTLVECGLASGTMCAQMALDTTGDGVVGDDDEKVFAATGGEIRIVKVDNNRSRLRLDFQVELGTNVLTTGDASTGTIAGCINARYDSAGGGASGWTLE